MVTDPWKARLPRSRPPATKVDFVFALKTSTGYRSELAGSLPQERAFALQRLAALPEADWEKLRQACEAAGHPL